MIFVTLDESYMISQRHNHRGENLENALQITSGCTCFEQRPIRSAEREETARAL